MGQVPEGVTVVAMVLRQGLLQHGGLVAVVLAVVRAYGGGPMLPVYFIEFVIWDYGGDEGGSVWIILVDHTHSID